MPNDRFWAKWTEGEDIALIGRNGPEVVKHATWTYVRGWCDLTVEGEDLQCSDTTKLFSRRHGGHVRITDLHVGDVVETLTGWKTIDRLEHHPDSMLKVLTISMVGPSHEYLVGSGLRTHNYKSGGPIG